MAELNNLIDDIKAERPDIKIWVYTGYTLDNLIERLCHNSPVDEDYYPDIYNLNKILRKIDYLVDGQFQEDKKDLTYPFAGSTNQKVIDMKRTRLYCRVTLLNEE